MRPTAANLGGSLPGKRLGVEITPASMIVAEIGWRAITRVAQISLPVAAPELALPVRSLLAQAGVRRAPVHLVMCDAEHVHRSLLVPPMTAREHAEVVSRETSREGEDDRMTAWRHVRRLEVDGLPKDELLIVSASSSTLQPVLDAFVSERSAPRVVTTGPLALMAAAGRLAPAALAAPTLLVHWGPSTLMLVFVSAAGFKFARVVTPPSADLDPLGWMPVEIDRSIRHYAIQSKGERVEHVMISVADAAAAQRLFAGGGLAGRLRLPLTNLNALLAPQLPASADAEGAGTYTLAYGAAVLRPGDAPNLLPRELVLRRRSKQVIMTAAATNVAAGVLLASAWLSASQDAERLRTRLAEAESNLRAREARLAEDARIEEERQRMRERGTLLTSDPLKLLPIGDVLKEIARLAPGPVRLDELTVSVDAQSYLLRLAGGVYTSDVVEAQRDLNHFYYGLRASPVFYDVQVQQPSRQGGAGAVVSVPEAESGATEDGTSSASRPEERPTQPFAILLKLKRMA